MGRISALELGLNNKRQYLTKNNENLKVLIIMGSDNIRNKDIPKNAFVVYIVIN